MNNLNLRDKPENIITSPEITKALSFRAFMAVQRVDPQRLEIKGYGKSRLIILSGSREKQALNRRVELVNAR